MELWSKAKRALGEGGPLVAALKAIRYPFKPLLVPGAIASLRRQARRTEGIEAHLQLTRTFKFGGITIPAWQVESEVVPLLELVEREQPKAVLELGSAQGGLLYLFSRVAAPDATLVSVDLPGGLFGGGYSWWRAPLYRSFARDRQRVEVLRRDSQDPLTIEAVRERFGDRQVDFLFIDADHRYEGVRTDFERYSPLVREGGLIAFHDIVPGPPESVGGVPTFWQELAAEHDTEEFVDDWGRGSCGIGIVRKVGSDVRESSPAVGDDRVSA